jgi:putative membrane protein
MIAPQTGAPRRGGSAQFGDGGSSVARTVLIGLVGLVLSTAPAWAGDAKAEMDFVTRASGANLVSIAESQLALARTHDAQVKAFARRLFDDHRTAEAQLQAAAAGSGARVSTTLDQADQARVTALRRKSGADFDKAYVADQYAVHSNALTLYGDYMLLGDNAKLNALAVKMIPIVEGQLKTAQTLAGD